MKVVIALLVLLVGPVFSHVDDIETVLAVTQCRASCLDQFSRIIRTEDNCRKDSNCLMCWETCQMLIENSKLWSPLCLVPDVCLPGCQKACTFGETKNDEIDLPAHILLRSVYEPHSDRVSLEWDPHQDMESEGTVIYSIFLKDASQKWSRVAQTTSHVVHIKRGLLSRNSTIRLIAANATEKISDSEVSYLNSFISGSSIYNGKRGRMIWKPILESMVQNEKSLGFLTTISWPEQDDRSELTQCEVSWNVIDDSIDITGHLYTTSNKAILTLWPDSLYSVQVNCYTSDKGLYSQSEPLIVDTRNSQKETSPPTVCSTVPGEQILINCFAFLSAFFFTFLLIAFLWVCHRRKADLTQSGNHIDSDLYDTLHLKVLSNIESERNTVMKHEYTKDKLPNIIDIKSEVLHII